MVEEKIYINGKVWKVNNMSGLVRGHISLTFQGENKDNEGQNSCV